MEPMADAAAVPEPEIAPKSILATALVCASAPGILPVKSFAKLMRRMAIPPLFMIFPARIKNGMAKRLNTEIPENIRCAPVSTAAPVFRTGRIAQMDDTARATAMGTPAKSITTKSTRMISPQTTAIFISYASSFPLKSLCIISAAFIRLNSMISRPVTGTIT